MNAWIATLERIFGGIDFVDGVSFLRVAGGITVIAFLLFVLFRWPDFRRIRWQFLSAVYWVFLLSTLLFPMPVSRSSIAIFQIIPRPTLWLPLGGLLENPAAVLFAWLQNNAPWLLAFVPLGVINPFSRPKQRLRYLHGPALSAGLLLVMLLLNRIMGADYLSIRMDRALAWALGFLIGQFLAAAIQKVLAIRVARRAPASPIVSVSGPSCESTPVPSSAPPIASTASAYALPSASAPVPPATPSSAASAPVPSAASASMPSAASAPMPSAASTSMPSAASAPVPHRESASVPPAAPLHAPPAASARQGTAPSAQQK